MSVWSRIRKALGLSPQTRPPKPIPERKYVEREYYEPHPPIKFKAIPESTVPSEYQYWDSRLSRNVWDRIVSNIPTEQEEEFARLFQAGWVTPSESTDERAQARDDFFDLLRADAIPIGIFPWAEWREWYDEQQP